MRPTSQREQIRQRLLDFYTPEQADVWLRLPHQLLGGKSADEVIEADEAQRVLDVIEAMDAGVYL